MTLNKFLLILFTCCLGLSKNFAQGLVPPLAPKFPHQYVIHGDTVTDNYFWLRDKYNADVVNHLYAENGYADVVMAPTRTLQKVLFEEFKSRRKEESKTRPTKREGYYYYNRFQKGAEYPLLCRVKAKMDSVEEVYMDMNKLAEEFRYFNLGVASMSENQNVYCYGIDDKGNRLNKLYFKILDTDSLIDDKIDSVMSVVWFRDNKTILYIKAEPKTLREYRIYKHVMGTDKSLDVLIMEEKEKSYQLFFDKTISKKYITLGSSYSTDNSLYIMDAENPNDSPRLFASRKKNVTIGLDHYGDGYFYINTNENAPNGKVLRLPEEKPYLPQNVIEIFPHREKVSIQNFTIFKNYIVVEESENAEPRILIYSKDLTKRDTLKTNAPFGNLNFNVEDYHYETSNEIEFGESNFITPTQTYKYNLDTKKYTFIEMDSLKTPYDKSNYITTRLYAPAKDGRLIPFTIVYKKGLVLNGNNPTFLTSYGAYGNSSTPGFSSSNLSLLDRGFVVAMAHIRGGSDLGRFWYDEGRMLNKMNTFTDFITCAEHLINEKYTNPTKLAIEGGSAGGLLMGAVTNLRPDLFNCVIAQVPFVDVINTMLDETLPLTTFEYDEWGNPHIEKYYRYIKQYSPYDNVERKNYPNLLITGGYDDSQVPYWEPAKWTAKLREFKTDTNLLLCKINMNAGHGGGSGRFNGLAEQAFTYAFMFRCLGIKQDYVTVKGKITDPNNDPMPFVNVSLQGTTKGTLSNLNGEYEIDLNLNEKPILAYSSLGFKTEKIPLGIKTNISELDVKLKTEEYQLKTVVITAKGKDPAYEIMRKAIDKRKENYERSGTFVADIYIRSTIKLIDLPKKIPAFIKIDMADTARGIVSLSESIARYAHRMPDEYKEEMFASKVAGSKMGFSWNRVSDIMLNFYEPNVKMESFSERPFVSPLSSMAMALYKFKYEGSFAADDKLVHKIRIIPRSKGDPLFNGLIYISDDNSQIYSCDMYITKEQQIDWADTIKIKQEFLRTDNGIYLPSQIQFRGDISVFGFKASDIMVGSATNYELNPKFTNNYFGYQVFKVNKDANKKDTSYWTTTRPILLSAEEEKHYKKEDSLMVVKNSKAYQDSVNKKENKFKISELLLTGYSYRNKFKGSNVRFDGLFRNIHFNSVEGLNYSLTGSYNKFTDSTFDFKSIGGSIHYGFSNKIFSPSFYYNTSLNRERSEFVNINGGRVITQFNPSIGNIINDIYTLLWEQNFMKLYKKDYLAVNYGSELSNGLYFSSTAQLSQRGGLYNTENFTFINYKNKSFKSNNPINPGYDQLIFDTHNSAHVNFKFKYIFKQRYEMIGNFKNIIENKYPELYLNLDQGVGLSKYKFNYTHLAAGSGWDKDLGVFGLFKADFFAGTFINRKNMVFADYKHINGNQTIYISEARSQVSGLRGSRSIYSNFHTAPYYALSTNQSYVEVHCSQNFRSFLIGKIPLLRKTKLYETVGYNMFLTPLGNYQEVFFGVDNIAKIFRVDFASGLQSGKFTGFMIRIGTRFF